LVVDYSLSALGINVLAAFWIATAQGRLTMTIVEQIGKSNLQKFSWFFFKKRTAFFCFERTLGGESWQRLASSAAWDGG
jgi:hypothetical protein